MIKWEGCMSNCEEGEGGVTLLNIPYDQRTSR